MNSTAPAMANARTPTDWKAQDMSLRLKKRYASERRFRLLGLSAVLASAAFLAFLIISMTANSIGGFTRTQIKVTMDFPALGLTISESQISGPNAVQSLGMAGLEDAVQISANASLGPDGATLLSQGGWTAVRDALIEDPSLLKRKADILIPVSEALATAARGEGAPEMRARYEALADQGKVERSFDSGFLSRSDATDPGQVGIWGALKGSILTMLVTLLLAFPVGVLAAVYLEEYAPRNRWTDIIEVSINNLAACHRSFSAFLDWPCSSISWVCHDLHHSSAG